MPSAGGNEPAPRSSPCALVIAFQRGSGPIGSLIDSPSALQTSEPEPSDTLNDWRSAPFSLSSRNRTLLGVCRDDYPIVADLHVCIRLRRSTPLRPIQIQTPRSHS